MDTYNMDTNKMNPALTAGTLSGIAGLLVFLIIHHFWIRPIWFILPVGLVLAALGGLAVGWSYAELGPFLPARPWTVPALVLLIALILLPAFVLAELRAPLFDVSVPGGLLLVSTGRAVFIFITELLCTATLAGGLLGWWIGGSTRAAAATALASFVFALGPGHNIPFLGSTPGVFKGALLLFAVVLTAAITLVAVEARLSGRLPVG
jgi:hypothetical protein